MWLRIKRKITSWQWVIKLVVLKSGVLEAIRSGCYRAVVSTWLTRQPPVVFYCHVSSHLQTITDVMREISADGRKVMLILGFVPEEAARDEINDVPLMIIPSLSVMALMKADIFVTPAVGIPRCYAPHESSIVHFMVSLTSLDGVYADHHFDDCDYIFCAGEHQIPDFVKLSKQRNLAEKVLIPGGYPKLDSQLRWLAGCRQGAADNRQGKVIVYAPTHVYPVNEQLASLRRYGEKIVRTLLDAGFSVIFRPHPASFKDEDKGVVERICTEHENNPLFSLDCSKNYMESYALADLMVTDLSGTGFTFAFTFQRPAVFFAANADAEVGLEGIQFHSRHEIGDVVRSLPELGNKCLSLLAHQDEIEAKIVRFRDKTVFNLGTSAKYFCHCLPYIERGEIDKGWVVL